MSEPAPPAPSSPPAASPSLSPSGQPERPAPDGTFLRIEIFTSDFDAFADFYTRVLGFTVTTDNRASAHAYAAVSRGSVRIGAAQPWEPVDTSMRDVPNGVELVLEVDDLDEAHRRVVASGWPLVEGVKERPWGLTDFRLLDPDGYYLRITTH